jgi:hypothetical protein
MLSFSLHDITKLKRNVNINEFAKEYEEQCDSRILNGYFKNLRGLIEGVKNAF